MRFTKQWVMIFAMILLAGCGGGGGGGGGSVAGGGNGPTNPVDPVDPTPVATTLEAVVAAGAPLAKAKVNIKDIDGNTKQFVADLDGGLIVDVKGLKAPAIIEAVSFDGMTKLYAIVRAEDYGKFIPVTPITTIIAANTLGQNPEDAYNGFSVADLDKVNNGMLIAAQHVYAALSPVFVELGVDVASPESLFEGFEPDHTGIDRVLDGIDVDITGTDIVVKDRLGNTLMTDTATTNAAITAAVVSDVVSESADVMKSLDEYLAKVTTNCGTSDAVNIGECSILFRPDFKHSFGYDVGNVWLPTLAEDFGSVPTVVRAKSPTILRKDATGYWVQFVYIVHEGTELRLEKDEGYFGYDTDWYFIGDGENQWLDLTLDVANNALYFKARSKTAPANFAYVKWTGPGIQASGIKSTIVAGRWPDSFDNYVSQVCVRLMSQIESPNSACNSGQYFDDVNYPEGTYLFLNYQAYDTNDQPIVGWSGTQWLRLQ